MREGLSSLKQRKEAKEASQLQSELASSPIFGRTLAAVGVVFGVGSWRERPAKARGTGWTKASKDLEVSVCLEPLTAPAKTGPDRTLGFVEAQGKNWRPGAGTVLRIRRAGCHVCVVGVPLFRDLGLCRVREICQAPEAMTKS